MLSDGAARPLTRDELAHRERSLIRTRHQYDIPAHHVTDRTGEQGVMRTAEDQRVHRGGANRRQQTLSENVNLVTLDVAGLHELDEARARGALEGDRSVERRRRRAGTRPTRSCPPCRSPRPDPTASRAPRRACPARSRRPPGCRAARAARRGRPTSRCCRRRPGAWRHGRRAGRRSRARTSGPRRAAWARRGTGRCRRSSIIDSSGSRSMSDRSTVSPPRPESKTPIGRAVRAAIRSRRGSQDAIGDRRADTLGRRRHDEDVIDVARRRTSRRRA